MFAIERVKFMFNSHFFKNISSVFMGTLGAQLITLLSIPVLTRLYSTEAFGHFGLVMAFASVLATLCTGRLNLAIMLSKFRNHAENTYYLAITIAWYFSAACLMLLGIYWVICAYLNLPAFTSILWLLPFMVLALGYQQSLEVWSSRAKDFKLLSMATFITALTGALIKVAAIYLISDVKSTIFLESLSLVLGTLLSVFVGVLIFNSARNKEIKSSMRRQNQFPALLKTYRQMYLFRAPKDCLNALSQSLPAFLLAFMYGASMTGMYIVAERIMRAPILLIGNSFRKVFFQKLVEKRNSGHLLSEFVLQMTLILALVSILPFLIIFFWGDDLFALLLGDEWRYTGEFASWLAIWLFFAFINIPAMTAIPLFNLEKTFLYYEIVSLVIRFSAFLSMAVFDQTALSAVAAYCVTASILNALLIFFVTLLAIRKEA